MSERGMAVALAARGLVGTRFRSNGHDPRHGLDCVGVALASFRAAGVVGQAPAGYPLRGTSPGDVAALVEAHPLRAAALPAEPGDLLLCDAGPAQSHFVVWTTNAFVHADAMLRRVVERPAPLPWRVIGHWRLREED